jgi:hypothetical protein
MLPWRLTNIVLLIATATLLYAPMAHANAGTPYVMRSVLTLAFGNIFIGIGEALILRLLNRAIKLRYAIPVLIAANYASMFCGLLIKNSIGLLITEVLGMPLLWIAPQLMVLAFFLLYAISIVLEWPFFWLMVRKQPSVKWGSLRPCVIAQTASYALLLLWFLPTSTFSMYTDFEWVEAKAITQDDTFTLIYIHEREMHEMALNGEQQEKLSDWNNPIHRRTLTVYKSEKGWVLRGRSINDWDTWEEWPVPTQYPVASLTSLVHGTDMKYWRSKNCIDYRLPKEPNWSARQWAYLPSEPMYIHVNATDDSYTFGLQTPLVNLRHGPFYLLPDDLLVVMIDGHVILANVRDKTLAVLTPADAFLVLPNEAYANKFLPAIEAQRLQLESTTNSVTTEQAIAPSVQD